MTDNDEGLVFKHYDGYETLRIFPEKPNAFVRAYRAIKRLFRRA